MPRAFTVLHSCLLVAFLVCLVAVPAALWWVAVSGLAVALVSLAVPAPWRLRREDGWWLVALAGFGTHLVLDAWRGGAPVGAQTAATLPWWPWLACLLLVAWRRHPPATGALWLGAGLAALGAGVVALYEWLVLSDARANNGINSIPFGNLSLLLGVLALVGALSWRGPWAGRLTCALAALAGMVASLLSGTRGGWITLPLVIAVLGFCYRGGLGEAARKLSVIGWVIVLALALALLVFAAEQALPRFADLVNDLQRYRVVGNTRTSVGLRLDMWHTAFNLFLQKPFFGWGEHAMRPALQSLIAEGRLNEQAQYFGYQLHNDWLDTGARRGVLGLLTLMPFFAVPLVGFVRRLRVDGRGASALAGLLLVLMFLGFGFTQTQIRDERAFAAYLVLMVTCWIMVRRSH